jgi:hypothetical protein
MHFFAPAALGGVFRTIQADFVIDPGNEVERQKVVLAKRHRTGDFDFVADHVIDLTDMFSVGTDDFHMFPNLTGIDHILLPNSNGVAFLQTRQGCCGFSKKGESAAP